MTTITESSRRGLRALEVDESTHRHVRMVVLARVDAEGQATNLFTTVRHRNGQAMGPWASSTDTGWLRSTPGPDLILLTREAVMPVFEPIIADILNNARITVGAVDVHYELVARPREHWLYRDDHPIRIRGLRSPFSRHSAKVTEYRSFDPAVRQWWLGCVEALERAGDKLELDALGFPLVRKSDRVGGLMIARASDELTCRLNTIHGDRLVLSVDANHAQLVAGQYRATVWASHSGDEVLREHVALTDTQLVFSPASSVDLVGFEIYRGTDGQCIDRMAVGLILDIGIGMNVRSGPSIKVSDKRGRMFHQVEAAEHRSQLNISVTDDDDELDNRIRRRWLAHQAHTRGQAARRSGELVRFGRGQQAEAIEHIVAQLRNIQHDGRSVYLIDPYLLTDKLEGDEAAQLRGYMDLFAAARGLALRILCSRAKSQPPEWWTEIVKLGGFSVEARSFFSHFDPDNPKNNKSALHDRCLITPEHELLMTNSVNGWAKHGVTFVKTDQGVYRAEAEHLWSLPIGWTEDRYVQEIQL